MNKLLLMVCLSLTLMTVGCESFSFGWQREDSIKINNWSENEEGVPDFANGHFNDDDEWIPDNEDIASTYKIPDLGTGFIFDVNSLSVSPSLQIELVEFDSHIPYINTLKVDFGVAYNRTFFYLGKLWTSIFEISTGVYVGWNFDDFDWKKLRGGELSYGAGATIIKF